jgi:hypothetical protein
LENLAREGKMKTVGDKLRDLALNAPSANDADKFGRSAFNRYYYAAFLVVRSALMNIDPGWARSPHKDLPSLLKGRIYKKTRDQALRLERARQLSPQKRAELITSIRICVEDLAQVLEAGYSARCVADYTPEEPALVRNGNLQLGGVTAATAQRWPDRAAMNAGRLQARWRELGF